MSLSYLIQHGFFVIKHRYAYRIFNSWRKPWFSFLGMQIGKGTILLNVFISWPNQVRIGKYCVLEKSVNFKYDGIWKLGYAIQIMDYVFIGKGCEFNISKGIIIGNYCNIAAGCRFVDHDHGIASGELIGGQLPDEQPIVLGEDVWLGCNVVILKGVIIGNGAVVGAGAVVTKTILPNEIWAGVPARRIGHRK